MLAAFFALLVGAQALPDTAAATVGIVLFAVLVVYCVARPNGGFDTFLIAGVPGGTTALLHDLAGMPTWVGLAFIPVALWLARDLDAAPTAAASPRASAGASGPRRAPRRRR